MNKMKQYAGRLAQSRGAKFVAGVVIGGLAAVSHAQVAAPDVSEVVSYIQSLWGPIALVGGALLTIHFGIKGYKMLRRV